MHKLKEEVGAVALLVPRGGDGRRGDEEDEGARVDLGHGCVGDDTTCVFDKLGRK